MSEEIKRLALWEVKARVNGYLMSLDVTASNAEEAISKATSYVKKHHRQDFSCSFVLFSVKDLERVVYV